MSTVMLVDIGIGVTACILATHRESGTSYSVLLFIGIAFMCSAFAAGVLWGAGGILAVTGDRNWFH